MCIDRDVAKFSEALEKISWADMPIQFRDFPGGTCGDMSDILAEHLYSLGYKSIVYICGVHKNQSHAWLEMNNLAIDVTAHQFEDIDEKYLIQAPHLWHSKFDIEEDRTAGYKQFAGPALTDLFLVHHKVGALLKA